MNTVELRNRILDFQYNPALIQSQITNAIRNTSNGEFELLDPTNPFVFLLQAGSVVASAQMEANASLVRSQYLLAAQTFDELYLHLTKRDFVNMFALPSKAQIYILFSLQDLENKMHFDKATGDRKLVIPRNTKFVVSGITFSIQYPVNITFLQHGGIKVIYDTEQISPLYTLETNEVPWSIRSTPDGDLLFLQLNVHQFDIETSWISIDSSTGVKQYLTHTDQFYTARVYIQNNSSQWIEVNTTHSPAIFDPNNITVMLRAYEGVLEVMLPQIYLTKGMVNTTMRVDIYTTKGDLDFHLGSYGVEAYEGIYKNIDTNEDSIYSAALPAIGTTQIFSDWTTYSGRNALTFDEVKRRALNTSLGGFDLPITANQLDAELHDLGYGLVSHVDNITDRMFLATRELPAPKNTKLITASSATVETITSNLAILASMEGVYDNGDSVTLTPNTIYQNVNGITKIVPADIVSQLLAQEPDRLASSITNGNYYFTPFHYVLDAQDYEFTTRAYYLDAPVINAKAFVTTNASTLLDINAKAYNVVKTPRGYVLSIVAHASPEVVAQMDSLVLQIAFIPNGERSRAYMTGVPLGVNTDGDILFEFTLGTNYELTKENELLLTSFKMYDHENRKLPTLLLGHFDLIFMTTGVMTDVWHEDDVDQVMGRAYLPAKIYGITQETLTIDFGKALTNLWSRARSIPSENEYLRHEDDVPAIYEKDVYDRDPTTGSAVKIVDGKATFVILHKKGDPKLDSNGAQIYQYHKGDPVLDSNNQPVIKSGRNLYRQFDVMLLEGAYWFSNVDVSLTYRLEMVSTLLGWITDDLAKMSKRLLEKSQIYFYPKATIGDLDVMTANGRTTRIRAGQSFQVNLLVPDTVDRNPELKNRLRATTIAVIAAALNNDIVAESTIKTLLRLAYGTDVYDAQVTGLGGSNLPAFTVLTKGARASIRKRLVVQGNNGLLVEEDVTVTFNRIGK